MYDFDLSSSVSIDFILAADVYGEILDGLLKFPDEPSAQLLGLCLITSSQSTNLITSLHIMPNADLKTSVTRFFNIESIPFERHPTKD